MEADINNGGFMQFLCNWGDPTCQLALFALGKIGATRTHAILAGMRGLIDRFEAAPEVIELNDIYGAMTEAEQARLQELDLSLIHISAGGPGSFPVRAPGR